MRLLLYIVALLTGFSAAQAARPVETAATTASTQVELAEAFGSAATVAIAPQFHPVGTANVDALDATPIAVVASLPITTTPVSRADVTRE
jgi:hypothetical protein